MENKPKQIEILPDFFRTFPARYGHVILRSETARPDVNRTSFIYALNSPLAAKRAGRLVSYAVAFNLSVAQWREVTQSEVVELVMRYRQDFDKFVLPRHGILRLETCPVVASFWADIEAGLARPSIHTPMLDIHP
jgi:hypothetical protein